MIKHLKQIVHICLISLWLAFAVSLASTLPVFAASQIYTVTCAGSNVQIKNNRVVCSTTTAVPKISNVGQPNSDFKPNIGVSAVTVDCGSAKPNNLNFGQQAAFKCSNGSTPKLSSQLYQSFDKQRINTSNTPSSTVCGQTTCSDSAIQCDQGNCDLIAKYVNPILNVLTVAFGLIAVISLILGGIMYITSEGDPQKASRAKTRIFNTIVAVVAYMFLYAFLQFLIPGGAFR